MYNSLEHPNPFWWWCFLNFQGDVAVCNWLSWYIFVVSRIWSHVCLCFLRITTFSCLAPEILLYVSGIGGGSVVLVSALSICFSHLKWPPVKWTPPASDAQRLSLGGILSMIVEVDARKRPISSSSSSSSSSWFVFGRLKLHMLLTWMGHRNVWYCCKEWTTPSPWCNDYMSWCNWHEFHSLCWYGHTGTSMGFSNFGQSGKLNFIHALLWTQPTTDSSS
jgi:hypothetical protein